MANENTIHRVAFANFVPTTAATYNSEVKIPKGTLLKSITSVEGTALAGGTNVTIKVGSQSITAALALAAFTGNDVHALTTEDGLVVTATGDLSITTTGTFTAGDVDIYIEYYFAPEHT